MYSVFGTNLQAYVKCKCFEQLFPQRVFTKDKIFQASSFQDIFQYVELTKPKNLTIKQIDTKIVALRRFEWESTKNNSISIGAKHIQITRTERNKSKII